MTGIFYGIYHRRTLQKAYDQEKVHHAIHQRQDLIAEAKEAWQKKQEGSKDDGECHLHSFRGLYWARSVLWRWDFTWSFNKVVSVRLAKQRNAE